MKNDGDIFDLASRPIPVNGANESDSDVEVIENPQNAIEHHHDEGIFEMDALDNAQNNQAVGVGNNGNIVNEINNARIDDDVAQAINIEPDANNQRLNGEWFRRRRRRKSFFFLHFFRYALFLIISLFFIYSTKHN